MDVIFVTNLLVTIKRLSLSWSDDDVNHDTHGHSGGGGAAVC